MKRHISIFAFLLGMFAATAQAADKQEVFGGYYYIEDKYQSPPSNPTSPHSIRLPGCPS